VRAYFTWWQRDLAIGASVGLLYCPRKPLIAIASAAVILNRFFMAS
jgi:hypothetical protein